MIGWVTGWMSAVVCVRADCLYSVHVWINSVVCAWIIGPESALVLKNYCRAHHCLDCSLRVSRNWWTCLLHPCFHL